VLAGAVFTWLLLGADSGEASRRIGQVAGTLRTADRSAVACAAVLYGISITLRAIRWSLLAHRSGAGPLRLLPVTATHIGLGHVLPARISDILMIGLLRGILGIRAAHGTAAVLLSKLLDLLAVGLVVALAAAGGAGSTAMQAASVLLLLVAVAGLAFLRRILDLFRRLAGRFLERKPRLARFAADLAEASGLWQERRSRTLLAVSISIAIWVAKLFMFVQLVSAVHLLAGLPVWKVFFAGAATELIMALPIQGLFGLGVAEAGWAGGLALVGVGGERAVLSGFSVHLIWMAMAVCLMLISLPALPFAAGKKVSCGRR